MRTGRLPIAVERGTRRYVAKPLLRSGIVAKREICERETPPVAPGGMRAVGSGLFLRSACLRTSAGSATPEYSRRNTGVRPAIAISAAREIDPTCIDTLSTIKSLGKVKLWHLHKQRAPTASHFRQSGKFIGSMRMRRYVSLCPHIFCPEQIFRLTWVV